MSSTELSVTQQQTPLVFTLFLYVTKQSDVSVYEAVCRCYPHTKRYVHTLTTSTLLITTHDDVNKVTPTAMQSHIKEKPNKLRLSHL